MNKTPIIERYDTQFVKKNVQTILFSHIIFSTNILHVRLTNKKVYYIYD